jgi:hypothetical protein
MMMLIAAELESAVFVSPVEPVAGKIRRQPRSINSKRKKDQAGGGFPPGRQAASFPGAAAPAA